MQIFLFHAKIFTKISNLLILHFCSPLSSFQSFLPFFLSKVKLCLVGGMKQQQQKISAS